ncbi:putative endonuclease lcl3 [Tilletia horrida]|nr:putative endonuclease lcl3 [Tilletia horrida]
MVFGFGGGTSSKKKAEEFPLQNVTQAASKELEDLKSHMPTKQETKTLLSNPAVVAALSAGLTASSFFVYKRFFRRIRNAEYLTPSTLRRRFIVGRVTSVGDADGFRLFHTPGPIGLRGILYRPPTQASQLREQTLSVRLAGADAPEAAHFGKEAQPFSKEAQEFLTRMIKGKTVWVEPSHVDQYKRLVGTPYVWEAPYVLGRTNVSLRLVQEGLATVYRQSGAAYGSATWWNRLLFKSKNGQARLERAERKAKILEKGMWSLGNKLELPDEYKRRHKADDEAKSKRKS